MAGPAVRKVLPAHPRAVRVADFGEIAGVNVLQPPGGRDAEGVLEHEGAPAISSATSTGARAMRNSQAHPARKRRRDLVVLRGARPMTTSPAISTPMAAAWNSKRCGRREEKT